MCGLSCVVCTLVVFGVRWQRLFFVKIRWLLAIIVFGMLGAVRRTILWLWLADVAEIDLFVLSLSGRGMLYISGVEH